VGEINAYDKVMIENQKKEHMKVKEMLRKSPSNRWFRDGEFTAF